MRVQNRTFVRSCGHLFVSGMNPISSGLKKAPGSVTAKNNNKIIREAKAKINQQPAVLKWNIGIPDAILHNCSVPSIPAGVLLLLRIQIFAVLRRGNLACDDHEAPVSRMIAAGGQGKQPIAVLRFDAGIVECGAVNLAEIF